MKEKIYLRLKTDEDGKKYIVDQYDREVEGIKNIQSEYGVGEVDKTTIQFYEYGINGNPLTNGGRSWE